MKLSWYRILGAYALTIGLAFGLAQLTRHWVVEVYRIPNTVMSPTLQPGDVLLVWKIPFLSLLGESKINRGDLLVFSDLQSALPLTYVRRVIGLPGDQIEMQSGQILLNGTPLLRTQSSSPEVQAEHLPEGQRYEIIGSALIMDSHATQDISPEHFWVLGDSRVKTPKKTYLGGIIHQSQILGKATRVWISIDVEASPQPSIFPKIRWERWMKKLSF